MEKLLFNLVLSVILIVIGGLVTFVETFNYRYNVLHYNHFVTVIMFLLIYATSVIIYSFVLLKKNKPTISENLNNPEPTLRRRHLTADSNQESAKSVQNIINESNKDKNFGKDTIWCALAVFILILSLVLNIVIFTN